VAAKAARDLPPMPIIAINAVVLLVVPRMKTRL
jgi:hypothetical protein